MNYKPDIYIKNIHKDYLFKEGTKDIRIIEDLGNGYMKVAIPTDNLVRGGTGFDETIFNHMENGIEDNNKAIRSLYTWRQHTNLELAVIKAAMLGEVTGDLVSMDFSDTSKLIIKRGVYDEVEQSLYAEDEEGNRAEIKGFGAAIG